MQTIFEKKGVNGVLEEIDLLGGDYARRLYFVALVDRARFDSNGVKPVLARIGERMTSDYDRRQVLQHIASRVTLDESGAAAYIQAMATMKSDYDQRQALEALMQSGASVDGDAIAGAVDHMKSSYDKRMVLVEVIGRGSLSRRVEAQPARRRRRHEVGLRPRPGAHILRAALRRRAGGARAVLCCGEAQSSPTTSGAGC